MRTSPYFSTHTFRPALLALLALLATAAPSFAQTDETVAALRRENDALRDRVAQLEAALESAQADQAAQQAAHEAQLAALTETIAALRTALAAQPTDTPAPPTTTEAADEPAPPQTAPPSDDPMASPGTLRSAVQRDHADTFLNLNLEEGTNAERAESRKRYLADLRRWTRRTERSFSSRIDWEIELINVARAEGNSVRITFHVIDTESGLPFDGEPSTTIIEGRPAQRFAAHPEAQSWRLEGLLAAAPVINTDRTEKGLIDTPPYLGMFTEFGFTIRATQAVPDLGVPQRRDSSR